MRDAGTSYVVIELSADPMCARPPAGKRSEGGKEQCMRLSRDERGERPMLRLHCSVRETSKDRREFSIQYSLPFASVLAFARSGAK